MTTIDSVRQFVANSLEASGLRGRGAVWRLKGPEVQWIIHLDQLPYGDRLGVDIGLDLQVETAPRRPTDCPVLLHLENMPFAADLAIEMALDLNSGMEPDRRRKELTAAGQAVGTYLAAHVTIDQVKDAFRAGDFRSGFIHKDARAFLESAGAPR